jgi:hypothetical protein
MRISFEAADDVMWVRIGETRLDAHAAPELRALASWHVGPETTRVLAGVSAVEFVDIRYRGQKGRKAILPTMGLEKDKARLLAGAIQELYGIEALGRVGRSRGRWFVELVVNDAPTVQ